MFLLPAHSRAADVGAASSELGTTLKEVTRQLSGKGPGTSATNKAAITSAMALLAVAERAVTDGRERGLVAAAYVDVARKALSPGLTSEMNEAFTKAEQLLAPKPADEAADLALISLAEHIGWAMPPANAERWLLRIEPLLYSPARRPALAGAWWALADRLDATDLRQECVSQGVRLAPGTARANAELSAISERQATRVRQLLMLVVILGAVAALPFWHRRDKATHASAVSSLGWVLAGNPPTVIDKLALGGIGLIVFGIDALVGSSLLVTAILTLLFVAVSYGWTKSLGIYELGVARHSIFGTRTMRYSELTTFRYGIVSRYRFSSRVYLGSRHRVSMTSESGKTISFARYSWAQSDEMFNALRDRASQAISRRMIAQLQSGQEVPWGRAMWGFGIFIGNEGIRVGGKTVPYDTGFQGRFEKGSFKLYATGEPSAFVTITCGADNFYPGLILLRPMLSGDPAA